MSSPTPARRVAFEVLLAVEIGGYAGDLLHFRTAKLSSADAALAREIVFGVLRRRAQIDLLITPYLRQKLKKLDLEVLAALRMGVYQLLYLEKIPPHAVVNESVLLVKSARKLSAAGLVNAILRKVQAAGLPSNWPDRATEFCLPEWLLSRWSLAYGEEKARGIAQAFLDKPEVFVRVPPDASPDGYPGFVLESTEVPGCYRVLSGNLAEAGLRQMDIGSQWVATQLEAEVGDEVLDLCAAPGNKTTVIAEKAQIRAACDLHLHRLLAMPAPEHPRIQLDARESLPFRRRFSRILLDAPCSGTGTLGRNPEIRWRISPEAVLEFPAIQKRLLRNALDVLAPEGTLIYSTCSLEVEENEDIVEDVCHDYDVEVLRRLPGEVTGDGFFVARIRARRT